MSEHQADDVQQAFRVILAVIAAIVILGIGLLIAGVLLYRETPGRHFPFTQATPSAPGHTPAPG